MPPRHCSHPHLSRAAPYHLEAMPNGAGRRREPWLPDTVRPKVKVGGRPIDGGLAAAIRKPSQPHPSSEWRRERSIVERILVAAATDRCSTSMPSSSTKSTGPRRVESELSRRLPEAAVSYALSDFYRATSVTPIIIDACPDNFRRLISFIEVLTILVANTRIGGRIAAPCDSFSTRRRESIELELSDASCIARPKREHQSVGFWQCYGESAAESIVDSVVAFGSAAPARVARSLEERCASLTPGAHHHRPS